MALTGKQKAAMLLMSLDAATAAELLKGVEPNVVQELAVELAHLDAASRRSTGQNAEIARQFCSSLPRRRKFHVNGFLKEMLNSTIGDKKAAQLENRIQDLLYRRDPLTAIGSVDSQTIASVLENEHPQTTAVVLSELPAEKSAEVLGFLDGRIRISAIGRMSDCETMTAQAKTQTAEPVCKRLEAIAAGGAGEALPARPEQSLRKVAVILRNLGKEIQDGLLSFIQRKDSRAGAMIANLMIVWDDIPQVADKSLQEALSRIDTRQLALALVKADKVIIEKFLSNISEQTAATLDEEATLLSSEPKKDVKQARRRIIQALREMNERGELEFIEEPYNA